MQVAEKSGGVFLLQEMRPVGLHGVLTNIASDVDDGWVVASLSPFSSELACETRVGSVSLVMSLDLALRFATTLLMLASRNLSELREHALADGELGEVTVAGRPRDFTVRWTSAERSSHIQVATEEGCLEVRLQPGLAAAVGFRILRQAAQIAP